MATVKHVRDPARPFRFTPAQRARLETMADAETEANATGDPDNPLLTDEALDRMASARLVRRARKSTGLSQAAFAEAFRINHGRLRDLEQGRTRADSAMIAYLTVIEREPELVKQALSAA